MILILSCSFDCLWLYVILEIFDSICELLLWAYAFSWGRNVVIQQVVF